VVRRYLIEVLGGAHPEALNELVATAYVDRTPGAPDDRGPAAVRKVQDKVHEVFSKVEYKVQELIAEGDHVVARYLVLATPRLKTGTVPVQPVVVNGITIFKLAGGKIQETWIMNDQLNMLRQLGFVLAPAETSQSTGLGAAPPPGSNPPPGKSPPRGRAETSLP
jgi:predicted ester cyclase